MERLRQMDKIAYIRFASVYRSFNDVETMLEELQISCIERRRSHQDIFKDNLLRQTTKYRKVVIPNVTLSVCLIRLIVYQLLATVTFSFAQAATKGR